MFFKYRIEIQELGIIISERNVLKPNDNKTSFISQRAHDVLK